MKIRGAVSHDQGFIESLLQRTGLPHHDVHEHLHNFLVVEDNDQLIGVGGLELYDQVALLRSLAVDADYRERGVARGLYQSLVAKAMSHNVGALYLLTDTASDYFRRHGFSEVARDDVPAAIKQTRQYSHLCPASASLMMLLLPGK